MSEETQQSDAALSDHEQRLVILQLEDEGRKCREEEEERYFKRERQERQELRDDSIRQAALNGALALDYHNRDAATVLAAAREIEAFMRGQPEPQTLR